MEPKTLDHIDCALRNEAFARWILNASPDRPDQSTVWGVVSAFYAAVHLVNAYLWEVHRFEPRNHHQRHRYVSREPSLALVERHYRSLVDLGWAARYDPSARMSLRLLVQAIRDLELIKDTVVQSFE